MSSSFLFTFIISIGLAAVESVLYGEVVKDLTEFPYVVKVTSFSAAANPKYAVESSCGGVIVNKFVVLTVAHCISESEQKVASMYVVAARIDFSDTTKFNGQRRNVRAYKVHKDFKKTDYHIFKRSTNNPNDIALLWVSTEFVMTPFVKPAKFPTTVRNMDGIVGYSVGWGVQECGYKSKILKKVQLKVMDTNHCIQKYIKFLPDTAFCVKSIDERSITSVGDSGGPFIYNNEVLGLLSSGDVIKIRRNDGVGKDVCDAKQPVAYTDLFAHKDWINLSLKEGPPSEPCASFNKFVKKCALITANNRRVG